MTLRSIFLALARSETPTENKAVNPLRQFVHVLAKDIRGHLPEIGVVVLLNIVLALMFTQTWEESFESSETLLGGIAILLFIVAWCALIGRVVQADGVAGKAPYWLTRPGSRPALLAAKLAFALLFLHLPSFLGQLAIVVGSGVPLSLVQLLLNQMVFAACMTLPLLALAALTTNFSRFMFASVAVAAVALFVLALSTSRSTNFGTASLAGSGTFYSGVTTFLTAAVLVTLALVAGVALTCQYRWRSALRVAIGTGIALALLATGMITLPFSLIQRARAAVIGLPTVASTIRLRDASERRIYSPDVTYIPLVVSLPIEIPDATDAILRYYEIELRAADGRDVVLLSPAVIRRNVANGWLDLQLSQADYDAHKDDLISVRLIAEIETYANRETEPIPLDGSFAIIGGRAQCGMHNRNVIWSLSCRTSFGWSSWNFYPVDGPSAQLLWLPLRLQFAINPVWTSRVSSGNSVNPLTATELPTSVLEPVSYTRQDVTFENVRLGDFGP
jgi:hypothetical protein